MTTDECRIWRERIGALVLGQLGPEERAATEAHLDGCPDCRAEAELLAPMASILRRADPERLAPAPAPPPGLANRIARLIAAERKRALRRRVGLGLGLAAAATAAAAAILLALSLTGSTGDRPARTIAFGRLPPAVSVRASLEPRPYGSDVTMWVHGFRPGALCTVWLRTREGSRIPAGSFRYVYGDDSDATELAAGIDPQHVRAIGLVVGSRTFVARVPRAGAATASG